MSVSVQFVQADLNQHKDQLIDLSVEYLEWVASEIFVHYKIDVKETTNVIIREYVPSTINKICGDLPPKGIYYLLQAEDEFIGMGGLRQLREDIGEIKRIYIRPQYRGQGLGKALVQQLLNKAQEFGYHSIYLDSNTFMKAAHQLYYSLGFVDRDEYPEVEGPPQLRLTQIFMEKIL